VSVVRASIEIAGRRIAEVEDLWYDRTRWASFVDGLKHVQTVEGPYPDAGAQVVWDSFPGGRGRVVERVAAYEPRAGQTLDVEDEAIRGRQRVRFAALGPSLVGVELELDYALKQGNLFTPVTDALFIRRAQRESLQRTLLRLRRELAVADDEIA
jgi:hypothetical protein